MQSLLNLHSLHVLQFDPISLTGWNPIQFRSIVLNLIFITSMELLGIVLGFWMAQFSLLELSSIKWTLEQTQNVCTMDQHLHKALMGLSCII